ncbi:Esterase [Symbiodinium microadriaticum]|uniref:Esterase n=1 Tax=Symbiodinium microadriaticum TaxID=2951 RepID=A0A1Q9CB81_SYMMI|nr:Esterase [Symbiodinium microadriaticum]
MNNLAKSGSFGISGVAESINLFPFTTLRLRAGMSSQALEVWQWLLGQGLRGKDIVVSGDSAGGNLALALLLKLQAIGAELPAGAVLLSPWVEMLPFSSKSWRQNEAYDYIGQKTMMEEFVELYTAGADHQDPLVAPLHASLEELATLPPLWISVGGGELLRSSIEGFAFRVIQASGDVHLYVGPGMPHVYQLCFWAYRPPTVEQLPRCCWSCRMLCPHHCTSSAQDAGPVWESMDQASDDDDTESGDGDDHNAEGDKQDPDASSSTAPTKTSMLLGNVYDKEMEKVFTSCKTKHFYINATTLATKRARYYTAHIMTANKVLGKMKREEKKAQQERDKKDETEVTFTVMSQD